MERKFMTLSIRSIVFLENLAIVRPQEDFNMPLIQETKSEMQGVLSVANAMTVAARTAPKARGVDPIETLIVHGEELETLSEAMKKHGEKTRMAEVFSRDAGNVSSSQAVVLIGLRDLGPKKMENPLNCGGCGFKTCAGLLKVSKTEGNDFPGPVCMFQAIDLGIALSSACSVAVRFHVDNRMMYTIGAAARKLGWMDSQIIIGIPLSCSGKNIFFDRG
jgi:uncharacterized ferredoxin-like protein